jgi:hypothetical protein
MNKLLTCTAVLLLLLGTQTTVADGRDGWNRGNSSYDRYDNGRSWGRERDDRRVIRSNRRDRDNVSISLSFGNVWPATRYNDWRYRDWNRANSGFGVGYTTAWGAPGWSYNTRQPVIIHQNTYVNAAPRTRVVTRSSRSGSSLLRDVNGRCFEPGPHRSHRGRGENRFASPGPGIFRKLPAAPWRIALCSISNFLKRRAAP